MIFAREISIFGIVVEGDAETIIKAIFAADDSYPEYGIVISDVVALADNFRSCSFSHVKHIGNFVAYFLARRFKFGNELQAWMESIPDDLAPLVTHDNA